MMNRPNTCLALVLLVGGVANASLTSAATVSPPPGGALTLGNSYTNATPTVTAASAATVNDLTANGTSSYSYADGFATSQTAISAAHVPANMYGFYDSYVFTIAGSSLASITSTINLGSGLSGTHLSNLDAQLFSLAPNASLPSFAPSGMVSDSVGLTNFSLSPTLSGSTLVLSTNGAVAPGTYVLEIRGLADGAAGASYAGTLNVAPVPLPAALPLLLSGAGLLGRFTRRRAVSA